MKKKSVRSFNIIYYYDYCCIFFSFWLASMSFDNYDDDFS